MESLATSQRSDLRRATRTLIAAGFGVAAAIVAAAAYAQTIWGTAAIFATSMAVIGVGVAHSLLGVAHRAENHAATNENRRARMTAAAHQIAHPARRAEAAIPMWLDVVADQTAGPADRCEALGFIHESLIELRGALNATSALVDNDTATHVTTDPPHGRTRIMSDDVNHARWLIANPGIEPTLIVDRSGEIRMASQSAHTLFGRHTLEGTSVDALVPGHIDGHDIMRAEFDTNPESRKMGTGAASVLAIHANGHQFPVSVSLVPVDIDDTPHIMATISTEVSRLVEQRDMATFVAQVTYHDLSEELQAIDFAATALLDPDATDKERSEAETDLRESLPLAREQLATVGAVAALGHNDTLTQPRTVNVNDLKRMVMPAGCHLAIHSDGTLIRGDRHLLQLALRQIVRNAAIHGGATEVTVNHTAGTLVVTDNGRGVNQNDFEDMWTRSAALINDNTDDGKGTRIIRRYTAALGGTVSASGVGGAATYTFTFPTTG